ncbi:MAG: citrate lyase beta subunit, partial [Clostridia bacterium]|nr:citrate lyase beta subunit [Clostridia bacterium]
FSRVARAHGLKVGFGGGISFDSVPFITKMASLADKFETRKVVFRMDTDERRLKEGILLAMEFETMYLKNKCDFYDRMANEDRDRLIMLEERVKKARSEV